MLPGIAQVGVSSGTATKRIILEFGNLVGRFRIFAVSFLYLGYGWYVSEYNLLPFYADFDILRILRRLGLTF